MREVTDIHGSRGSLDDDNADLIKLSPNILITTHVVLKNLFEAEGI